MPIFARKKTLDIGLSPLVEGGRVRRDDLQIVLQQRRWVFLALNVATIAALTLAMAQILSIGGWSIAKVAMLVAYITTLPWLSIGFWNAIIGFLSLARQNRSAAETTADDPLALHFDRTAPLTTRTAVVMALRNEDAASAIARLRTMHDDLLRQGCAAHFDFHVLSDTNDPAIAKEEEQLVSDWRGESSISQQIFYRRRHDNAGYKAGNIDEFCRRTVKDYDFFLPLDADSLMSAAAIQRLVRILEANPRVGILQTLVVGAPAKTFFARAFQFGMRHGMRAYTSGSVWWQGDCGPYWGHNALVRMRPFHEHCALPKLPGRGPLSGYVMSHDQVEAVLMRKAGYHVRVLTDEFESWEENPPTLPDFVRRDLRWCQGNMQYFQLIGLPGLLAISRIQLALAILMFVGSVGWMAFILFGLLEILTTGYVDQYPIWQGLLLFCVVMTMTLAPKLMGLMSVLISRKESARYGGRLGVVAGGLLELLFSMLMAPVVSSAIAVFILGLLAGKRIDWQVQTRSSRGVTWIEAAQNFLPQTLLGITIFWLLAVYAPLVLAWAVPVIAGLVVSIPFAVWTASRVASNWSTRREVFDIPEDRVAGGALTEALSRHHSAAVQAAGATS